VRHTLKLHGVIVGHSELEHAEPGVGRAWGAFRPGVGYELVQPVFRLFAQAHPHGGDSRDDAVLDRYYSARDALNLELVDGAGSPIPTSTIHIADYTVEEGPAAIELDVLIADDNYWARRMAHLS
jgi:hypothetical protein